MGPGRRMYQFFPTDIQFVTQAIQYCSTSEFQTILVRSVIFNHQFNQNELMKSKNEQFWTYHEVADFFGCQTSTVHNWRKRGIITPIVLSKRFVRFDKEEILKLARERGLKKK
jgi:hypothetical protein